MFLVKVTTAKTIAPKSRIFGRIKSQYALKYDLKSENYEVSSFTFINFAIPSLTYNSFHNYTEIVKYLDLEKMQYFFEQVGFKIVSVFGDYDLNPFHKNSSDRLILVMQ